MSIVMDLNADIGESAERIAAGSDARLMQYITSASIACGGHAGDASTMRATLELAREHGVAAGAHPSYPDRERFGRVPLSMALRELQESLRSQLEQLLSVAVCVGVPLMHVKPHGALYHSCNVDPEIATAFAQVILDLDRNLVVLAQTGSRALAIYKEHGLVTAEEAFADRAYESDGTLRDRRKPGAILEDPLNAAKQATEIALRQRVFTEGEALKVRADSLCVHSDTPNAASIAKGVREWLENSGVQVRPLFRTVR